MAFDTDALLDVWHGLTEEVISLTCLCIVRYSAYANTAARNTVPAGTRKMWLFENCVQVLNIAKMAKNGTTINY